MLILECIPLCTNVIHNTVQSSSDNIPPLPPDNHHSSVAVYLRRGGIACYTVYDGSLVVANGEI